MNNMTMVLSDLPYMASSSASIGVPFVLGGVFSPTFDCSVTVSTGIASGLELRGLNRFPLGGGGGGGASRFDSNRREETRESICWRCVDAAVA